MEKKINLSALRNAISDKGFSISEAAVKTGVEEASLNRKLEGLEEFKASEIYRLTDMLGFSNEEKIAVFFAEGI